MKQSIFITLILLFTNTLFSQDFKGIYVNDTDDEFSTIITIPKGDTLFVNGNIEMEGYSTVWNAGDIYVTDTLINNTYEDEDFFTIGILQEGTFHFIGVDTCVITGNTVKFINVENENTKVLANEKNIQVFGEFRLHHSVDIIGNVELNGKTFQTINGDEYKIGGIFNETNINRIYNSENSNGNIIAKNISNYDINKLGLKFIMNKSSKTKNDFITDITRKHKSIPNVADGSIKKSFIVNPNAGGDYKFTIFYFDNDITEGSTESDFKLWHAERFMNFNKVKSKVLTGFNFVNSTDAIEIRDMKELTISDEICDTPPQINFANDTVYLCANSSITINSNPSPIGDNFSFVWYKNNHIINSTTNQELNVENGGVYKVLVTDSRGCFNYDSVIVIDKPLPHAGFDINPFSYACDYDTIHFINHSTCETDETLTYSWNFGDGITSNEKDPNILFVNSGIRDISLTIQTQFLCSNDTTYKNYTINPKPIASFSVANNCSDEETLFVNNSNGNGDAISSNTWIFGENIIGDTIVNNDKNIYHQYSTGAYSIKLITLSSGNCLDTFVYDNLNIYPEVNANFTFENSCQKEIVNIKNTSTSDATITSYLWEFEGGNSSYENPQIRFLNYGNKTIKLISSTVNCSDTISHSILVNPKPIASFSFEPVCPNTTTIFINNSTIPLGEISSYYWDFKTGDTSTDKQPEYSYSTSGTYNVELICTSDSLCSDTINNDIIIFASPQANFSSEAVCLGETTMFNNNSTISEGSITSYLWEFDEFNQGNETNPSYEYSSSGSHEVKLIAYSNHSCTDTITDDAVVYSLPYLDLGGTIQTCENSIIVDADPNGENVGSTFLWSNDSTEQTNTFTENGDYYVTITNENSCSYTENFAIVLNDEVLPNLGEDVTVCDMAELDAHNPGANYLWNTGYNGRYLTVTSSGEYSVIVTDPNECIGYDTIQVIVNYSPEVDLGADINACESTPEILTANTPSGETVLWSTGEISHSISISETSNIWLQLTSTEDCSNRDTVHLEFYNMPTTPFGTDTSSCYSINLDALNAGFEYLWSDNSTDRILTVNNSGTYSVIISNTGCSVENQVDVFIDPVPNVDLGDDVKMCEGEAVLLDANLTGMTYLWSNGSNEQTITTNLSGNYNVIVTNSLDCQASDDINVSYFPKPIFNLGNNQIICNDETLILDPNIEAESFKWYNKSGLISTNKTVEVNKPDTIWLETLNLYGCSYSDTVKVSKNPYAVEADFLLASEINAGDTVQIINLSSPENADYLWTFGDGTTSNEYNPQHKYFIPNEYTIILDIENGGCSSSLSKIVTVNSIHDKNIENEKFVISAEKEDKILSAKLYPNPNNGHFICEVKLSEDYDIYFKVYNINGLLLFNRKKHTQSNLNTDFSLQSLPAGLYFLQINVEDETKILKFVKIKE